MRKVLTSIDCPLVRDDANCALRRFVPEEDFAEEGLHNDLQESIRKEDIWAIVILPFQIGTRCTYMVRAYKDFEVAP